MDANPPQQLAELTTAQLAEDVRAALADTYAHPIVIELPERDGVAVIGGKPLELARTVLTATHGADVAARVHALDAAALPWFAVPAAGLRLWRQHGRGAGVGELVTELEAGDPPVQQIVDEDGWRLIRLADGAQGWIEPAAGLLAPAREQDLPDEQLADASRVDVEAFVAAVLAFEGVPYVWGGTTDAGVDCSGIVQRAAWRAGRAWLPRHSRALLRAGRRVSPRAIERGDLLVLQRDPSTYEAERRAQLEALDAERRRSGAMPAHGPAVHPMHVAVALSADEVVHASRDAMGVVREQLAALRERYRVLGVRRLGPTDTLTDTGATT